MLLSILIGSSYASKPIHQMNYDELKIRLQKAFKENDKFKAIIVLNQMLEKHSDQKDISKYRLALGDVYYSKKDYKHADKYYNRYRQDNPGNDAYAAYKSVLCKFFSSTGVHRDQSPLVHALRSSRDFLDKYSTSKYCKEIKNVEYTCEKKILDHDFYVVAFYIRRGNYKSAKNRIEDIKKKKLKDFPEIEPRILHFEAKLAYKQSDKELAEKKGLYLAKKFPKSEYVAMTEKMFKKNDYFFF